MARKTKLTPELIDAIAKRIRAGSFPHVAAASCGVPQTTYYRWIQRGKEAGAPKLQRELWEKISEAAASARVNAELRVFRDAPFQWLRYGPGRERPNEPGWTQEAQTLKVEGSIEHDHSVAGGVSVEEFRRNRVNTLAGAFAILEDMGFIQRTQKGEEMFKQLSAPEDEGGNGETVIDVDSSDGESQS